MTNASMRKPAWPAPADWLERQAQKVPPKKATPTTPADVGTFIDGWIESWRDREKAIYPSSANVEIGATIALEFATKPLEDEATRKGTNVVAVEQRRRAAIGTKWAAIMKSWRLDERLERERLPVNEADRRENGDSGASMRGGRVDGSQNYRTFGRGWPAENWRLFRLPLSEL